MQALWVHRLFSNTWHLLISMPRINHMCIQADLCHSLSIKFTSLTLLVNYWMCDHYNWFYPYFHSSIWYFKWLLLYMYFENNKNAMLSKPKPLLSCLETRITCEWVVDQGGVWTWSWQVGGGGVCGQRHTAPGQLDCQLWKFAHSTGFTLQLHYR